MFSWIWIFGIILFCASAGPRLAAANITSCEEFERGAKFNPYDIIDSMWKIFYFWAETTEIYPIVFSLATKKRLFKFKETIDVIDPNLSVEWNKATFFMNPKPGTEVLFLDMGSLGAFRGLVKVEQRKVRPYPVPLIKFAEVRMKLVDKYLGMMCCEDLTAYALAPMGRIPATKLKCIAAASSLGYDGENGQSYLDLNKKFKDEL